MNLKKIISIFSLSFFFVKVAEAHEAYVLDEGYFWSELQKPYSMHAIDSLKNTHNLDITIIIVISVLILLFLNFLFNQSKIGQKFSKNVEKLSFLGPIFVRLAISSAFFFSATSWSFLGPELPLTVMPYAGLVRIGLFIASGLIALGLFTEIAAFISLVIFTIGFFFYGTYLFTYLNYLGEIIVLLLFGMRKWSIDGILFGQKGFLKKWKKYDTTIIRVLYGIALSYAAITVKFLHPDLTVSVVNDWNLSQFHWLFPSDPLLVTLGAGIVEFIIGVFIIFGFEMRLTVIISLFYITLSLLYFRELVWPHFMLYGISLNLIVQPEIFTIDHLLLSEKRKHFWKRPFKPHVN